MECNIHFFRMWKCLKLLAGGGLGQGGWFFSNVDFHTNPFPYQQRAWYFSKIHQNWWQNFHQLPGNYPPAKMQSSPPRIIRVLGPGIPNETFICYWHPGWVVDRIYSRKCNFYDLLFQFPGSWFQAYFTHFSQGGGGSRGRVSLVQVGSFSKKLPAVWCE